MHQSDERKKKNGGVNRTSLDAANCVTLGRAIVLQQNANVDFNYLNFPSRFDCTERNASQTGPETDGCCTVLEQRRTCEWAS